MHVEPVLRNVDANETHIHPLPSLSKRASSFAAQATVRGRWNGGWGPLLPRGLGVPVGTRSPSRHRIGNNSRCGGRQVTRGTMRSMVEGACRAEPYPTAVHLFANFCGCAHQPPLGFSAGQKGR